MHSAEEFGSAGGGVLPRGLKSWFRFASILPRKAMNLFNRVSRRIRNRGRKRPVHLPFVEDRVLLATFTVTK